MSECVHGLDTAWCAICKHGPSRPELVTIQATFSAKYVGHCNGCDLPIQVDQVVHKLSTGQYVHQECQP